MKKEVEQILNSNTYGIQLKAAIEQAKITDGVQIAELVNWWNAGGVHEYIKIKGEIGNAANNKINTRDDVISALVKVIKAQLK